MSNHIHSQKLFYCTKVVIRLDHRYNNTGIGNSQLLPVPRLVSLLRHCLTLIITKSQTRDWNQYLHVFHREKVLLSCFLSHSASYIHGYIVYTIVLHVDLARVAPQSCIWVWEYGNWSIPCKFHHTWWLHSDLSRLLLMWYDKQFFSLLAYATQEHAYFILTRYQDARVSYMFSRGTQKT